MAAETVIQFGVVEADAFGSTTGWKATSLSASTTKDRANVLDNMGNEVAASLYNEKTDYSAKYSCNANTNTIPATIGKLVGNAILTSIKVQTSNKAYATMDLSGHQHAANTHADTLQQAAHSITLSKAFGAVDFMGGTGASGSAVVSGSIEITCQHQDVEDDVGGHLVGENYNAMITATTVWNGSVSAAAAAGWDVTVVETPSSDNTGFITTTVTGIKKLALA